MKYCLKTKNSCLKTQIKHPFNIAVQVQYKKEIHYKGKYNGPKNGLGSSNKKIHSLKVFPVNYFFIEVSCSMFV